MNTRRSKFQGDTEDKCVRYFQPPLQTASIWLFKLQAIAGWEAWGSVGPWLHGQWLVHTPCHYMCSGNYWTIRPANYLAIQRWSLLWAIIWEAVAGFLTSLAWQHPLEKTKCFQEPRDRRSTSRTTTELQRADGSGSEVVQSSSFQVKRKAITDWGTTSGNAYVQGVQVGWTLTWQVSTKCKAHEYKTSGAYTRSIRFWALRWALFFFLHVSSHLISPPHPEGRRYYLYFTDKAPEAQKG